MSGRLRLAPTKSALLQLRRQLAFLQQGHDLLERKRELLTFLVHERLATYRQLRNQVRNEIQGAYHWLAITHLRMDSRNLGQVRIGLKPAIRVQIRRSSHLGVEFPAVQADPEPVQPLGLMGTDPSLDETRARLTQAALLLARLGETESALWRLLKEQRKTQKRVNALKYNLIPKYRDTIGYIQGRLEEEERDTLFQVRVLQHSD